MKIDLKKIIVALVLGVVAGVPAYAAPASVKARLDSATMLMGNINMMHVEVVSDAKAKGAFPLLEMARQQGYATVCGDSVELRMPVKIDTVELGSGRLQYNYDIPVQAFDSGYYKLPPLVYVVGKDSVKGNELTLRVMPVAGVKAEDEISPYADVVGPDGGSFADNLPDWVVDYWWVIVAILLLIGLTVWALLRMKKNQPLPLVKPKELPRPWTESLQELQRLKDRKLWENGQEKEYFTALTDILRVYLDRRFGINAMEMTSRQIMNQLRDNDTARDKRDYVRQILDIADFVKFAKVRPLPDDNTKAYENAVNFVKQTELSGEAEAQFMEGYAEREQERKEREARIREAEKNKKRHSRRQSQQKTNDAGRQRSRSRKKKTADKSSKGKEKKS